MFMQLVFIALLLAGFRFFFRYLSRSSRFATVGDKSVLITGCDSGFGKALALQLSKKGMTVFAACLTEQGKTDLASTKNIQAFVMDVTKPESVKAGFEFVNKKVGKNGLWGVVNNAGVLRGGAFELTPLSDWDLQYKVNVMGIACVTQTFLPLLRSGKEARIVNISSVAGRFAFPGNSAYAASKFAVQGLSDSLRREMTPWGIKVIIIEPGVMRTPLWDVPFDKQKMEANLKTFPSEIVNLYGSEFFEKGHEASKEMIDKLASDPQLVVDVLDEALTTRFPLTRYSVGKDTPLWFFLAYAPTWLSDYLVKALSNAPVPAALKKRK